MNKQTAVAAALEARAAELGPGSKLPTFRDLQKEMGVSRTTLSTVLDALESKGVLTRRHGVGIFASDRLHQKDIVLLAAPAFFRGGSSDPFWGLLLEEAHRRAKTGSETLSVQFLTQAEGCTPRIPPSLISDIDQGKVDGIIGVGLEEKELLWIEERDIPFSAFASRGRCRAEFNRLSVLTLAVEELAKRGCRRLEMWEVIRTEHDGSMLEGEKSEGEFQRLLEARGLPPGAVRRRVWPNWRETTASEMLSIPLGAEIVEEAVKSPSPLPDGIVVLEDTVSRGVVPALMRRGIMAGRDVLIATHANIGSSLLSGFEDMLIQIAFDPAQLAKELFRLLEIQMAGAKGWEEGVVLTPTVIAPTRSPSFGRQT